MKHQVQKNDRINKDHSQSRNFKSSSSFATVESSDPQLDIPPDPDLERNNRIRSSSFSSNSINPAHKTLVSKRDRAATKFLLNITTSPPAIPERQALTKSPTKSVNVGSDLKDSLSLPRRAYTAPNGLLSKSQTDFTKERIIISSSSSDSSSDEDQQFYKGTGSYTDEDFSTW
ncbi:hypothetical protein DSO57_1004906 [Entomophthora muscae]|uniref:Uncharacterized protein n=1 Tax=Entomophthora muscae TaxID=34485 RepID=A0ACC2SKP2_9FUNG|nr:hypothetical protein DSO57_1004906 [Entomophthora muscae]